MFQFHYIPVVSEPDVHQIGKDELASRRSNFSDFNDLSNTNVYVSGSAGMVYATLDSFVDRGMPEENMFSDVFSLLRDKNHNQKIYLE